MLKTLSLYFLGLIQLKLWDKRFLSISSFVNLVKYYINKFYGTTSIVSNKIGQQKWTLLGHGKTNTD